MHIVKFKVFPGVPLNDDKTKALLEVILNFLPEIVFCSNRILTIL